MKIRCTTSFDITATGVTGHYRPGRVPFRDSSGQMITNERDWNRARNQQRNWETITQLISLRTQVNMPGVPVLTDQTWSFEFEVESNTIFASHTDPLGVLKNDCYHVPMLLGPVELLNETNIHFEIINN